MLLIEEKQQVKRALDILQKAFRQSPGITWMISNPSEQKIRCFLSMFLQEAIDKKGAYLTEDNNGVVLFFIVLKKGNSLKLFLKKMYVFFFIMGIQKGIKAIKYQKMVNEIRPKNGWLGWLVATDDNGPNCMAAYEIKRWMYKNSDETALPIFVETTTPRVAALYRAAGYKEYNKIKHPHSDIHVWFMRREPKL